MIELDFPCSWTFRRYEAFANYGIVLPDIETSDDPHVEDRIKALEEVIGKRQVSYQLTQLRGEVKHIEKKLTQSLLNKKRKRDKHY